MDILYFPVGIVRGGHEQGIHLNNEQNKNLLLKLILLIKGTVNGFLGQVVIQKFKNVLIIAVYVFMIKIKVTSTSFLNFKLYAKP